MIEDLKKQFFDLLLDIGFVGRDDRNGEGQANANSDNINVIKGVLCAGLYPNVTKGIVIISCACVAPANVEGSGVGKGW